ncbi:prophage Lp3 protein 15, terminase large subunit [Pediococcus damnosus]|uniref:terminase large subunit n=1 Tax=Pediococcus damnosus TaxID=51663 RepID=UPI00078E0CCC|nr:terminase TerL endonuclease subunit [Pediococcus damnosus]AMV60123.1 prophage Lp3 protein 15, terminase large subunit [Pediococcus damnosus]AMV64367.1 prophage Lp3 protein 15, terminase large subunit [Pediococcus damnosus]
MVDSAKEYCEKVLSGEIVAGKKIKQACQRHLNDLKKQRTKDFPYYFDVKQAQQAISLIELLPRHDGEKLKMLLFQKFILASIYGWREVETGYRRFRQAYISLARKNGKTYLASGMAVNTLIGEKLPKRNRSIYFVANSAKQSRLGFDMMSDGLQQVRKKYPYMRKRIKVQKQAITDLESGSKATALASKTNSMDGLAGTLIIYDEYHAAKTREVYNVMKSGQAQEPNALLTIISTAGTSPNVPMHDDYLRLSKVLNGKAKDDRYFIAIWELDDKKEVYDQSKWEKANPIFADPDIKQTMTESIQGDVDEATQIGNLAPVLVKSFNMWENANTNAYISLNDWKKHEIEKEPDLNNKEILFGLDLSVTGDLTAVSWLVPIGNNKFYVDSHAFVAKVFGLDQKSKTDGVDYRALAQAGECTITDEEDGTINYKQVFNYMREKVGNYNWIVKGVCYDPWRMSYMKDDLNMAGYPMIEVRQYQKFLSIPTTRFKQDLLKGNIVHTSNKLLGYNVNNAVLEYDSKNNPIISKTKHSNKIDEIASLINAYAVGYDYYEKQRKDKADNEFYSSDDFGF